MADLQRKGIGLQVKQADPFTEDDEAKLWDTSTITHDTALGLSYGMYFYNNLCFGLRAADEHRELETSQFKFVQEKGKEKLLFSGRG